MGWVVSVGVTATVGIEILGTRELWKVMREAFLTTPPPAHSTQQGRGAAAILTPFVEKLASWDVLGGLPSVLPCGGRVGWREGELGV